MAIKCQSGRDVYEWWQCLIGLLSCGWFADPKNLRPLQKAFVAGWQDIQKVWQRKAGKTWYQRNKPTKEPGVCSGATRDVLTLNGPTIMRVINDGIKLYGSQLTGPQLAVRRRYGGIAGRTSNVDNRITPQWKIGKFLTARLISPPLNLPQGNMDINMALARLPVKYNLLRQARAVNGGIYFVCNRGRFISYAK